MKSIDISQKQESIHYWVNNRIFELFYPAIKYLMKVPAYFDNSASIPCDAESVYYHSEHGTQGCA